MFHGQYSCAVVLDFVNAEAAAAALKVLGDGWKQTKLPSCLMGTFSSVQLETFKSKFNPQAKPCQRKECRGKKHEIDGLEHSIDMGPRFDIELDVVVENKDQLPLFGG